ncbi:MAG: hypothetical protein IT200_04445 [Thermoleophilia bacterium]|nr:hypothetical protein [Thermoleophilia bacterium]
MEEHEQAVAAAPGTRRRRGAGAGPLVQALWRYERGRPPLRMRLPEQGIAEVEDAQGTGHLVVLAAPPRSPLHPARIDPAAVRALEMLGWARTFLVWPSDDGRRARIVGPSHRWAPARWQGMQDVVAHAGGGELRVWAVTGEAGRSALGLVAPTLRARLGLADAPSGALGARVPDFVRTLREIQEGAPVT